MSWNINRGAKGDPTKAINLCDNIVSSSSGPSAFTLLYFCRPSSNWDANLIFQFDLKCTEVALAWTRIEGDTIYYWNLNTQTIIKHWRRMANWRQSSKLKKFLSVSMSTWCANISISIGIEYVNHKYSHTISKIIVCHRVKPLFDYSR